MEVLSKKKRGKGLEFQPEEPEQAEISDEEYGVLGNSEESFFDEEKLKEKLEALVDDYYRKTLGKDPQKLSLQKKQAKLKWIDHLSTVEGDPGLNSEDLSNDFKRELAIYNLTLQNAQKSLQTLKELQIPIWRPNDFKAEMFKSDQHMKKVENNLTQAKKKIELVEKRKQATHKKKFIQAAHQKHVKAKQQRQAAKSSKKNKRPGKWKRQRSNKK